MTTEGSFDNHSIVIRLSFNCHSIVIQLFDNE